MFMTVRWMIRLAVLALAGYGAKVLYDKYAARAPELREPSREFLNRTKDAVTESAQRVTGAARDLTDEIKDAANHVTEDGPTEEVVAGTGVDPVTSRFSAVHPASTG